MDAKLDLKNTSVLKIIPVPLPLNNRTPYLGAKLDYNFEFIEEPFYRKLANFIKQENDQEEKENTEKYKLNKEEKKLAGFYLEGVTVKEKLGNNILFDVSFNSCNLAVNDAIFIKYPETGKYYEAFIIKNDGDVLEIKCDGWRGSIGEYVDISKNFYYYQDLGFSDKWEDNFYRLLRAESRIRLANEKLKGLTNPLIFQFEKVSSLGELNKSQIQVFNECLNSQSVTLVQGPPGTGKTTFAAHLAKFLKDSGHSVLVTGFTHDAINNILEKISNLGGTIRKIGKSIRSSHALVHHTSGKFESSMLSESIAGMTIHEFFKNHYEFDFIIVDEASQMDIASGLHFLASSKKTIFIGDQMQLPSISRLSDPDFSISIFDLLLEYHNPQTLEITYRFNQGICDYISPNFYNGVLKCHPLVNDNYLRINSNLTSLKYPEVIDKNPLNFIQTNNEIEFILNEEQANISADLVEDLLAVGLLPDNIGIIAPTNMQVHFIKKVIKSRGISIKDLKIDTVNKFQGQERDIIIYNTVVTKFGSDKVKYDFYFDIRRFNVAISRARQKVIVLGNKNLLSKAELQLEGGKKIADFLNKSIEIFSVHSK